MQYKIRWTITMKVGSIVTVLIFFILILLINSMIALSEIQSDLKEIATVDVPLAEISNEMEITQLERQIAMDGILQTADPERHDVSLDETRVIELGRKINKLIDRGASVVEKGSTAENREHLQPISISLDDLKDEFMLLDQALIQWIERLSSGNNPDSQFISAILRKNEVFDGKTIRLIKAIDTLTERKTRLAVKHEQLFKIVNISLGFTGAGLGILLGSLIVAGIRANIFQLSKRIKQVTTAIKENGDIPRDEAGIINSSDELGKL